MGPSAHPGSGAAGAALRGGLPGHGRCPVTVGAYHPSRRSLAGHAEQAAALDQQPEYKACFYALVEYAAHELPERLVAYAQQYAAELQSWRRDLDLRAAAQHPN